MAVLRVVSIARGNPYTVDRSPWSGGAESPAAQLARCHRRAARYLRAAVASLAMGMLISVPLRAQAANPDTEPVPEPPPIPQRVQSGEPLGPAVTITEQQQRGVTEYRAGNHVVAVKVQPKGAPAYFLVNANGNATTLQSTGNPLGPDFFIPAWVILRW